MVNDVLQKHRAFWHPGRGSPYHLNLDEGRARREFPSNTRNLVRSRHSSENSGHQLYKRSTAAQPEMLSEIQTSSDLYNGLTNTFIPSHGTRTENNL